MLAKIGAEEKRVGFIHQDRDFADLVRIVASETGLSPGLVEKDY